MTDFEKERIERVNDQGAYGAIFYKNGKVVADTRPKELIEKIKKNEQRRRENEKKKKR